ncbi:MAG: hypothetical protein IPJ46_05665 [Anaerolineales bacterium]|nr:hypothetical protein [Anaerolineales bacterium]
MNNSLAQFIFLLLLAALYLPVIFFAIQRRDEGYGAATWLVAFYALLAMVMNIAEAIWRNGESAKTAQQPFGSANLPGLNTGGSAYPCASNFPET